MAGTLTQAAYLKASNTEAVAETGAAKNGPFGSSVALSGDTIVVGANGENGSGFTNAIGVFVNAVRQPHEVVNDSRIDFVMKPGVAGTTVDVVLVKANNTVITITQACTFEAPTSGVTITMPSQSALRPAAPAVGASMVVTCTPVEQPAEPPGDVPLSFFDVSVSIDDSPISTLINPAILELPVDPMMVPAGQVAQLFEWVAASSWSPAAGIVTAPIQRLGNYVLATEPAHRWWFPVVTLE